MCFLRPPMERISQPKFSWFYKSKMPANFTNFSSSSSLAKAMLSEELKLHYKKGPYLPLDHTIYKRMRNMGKSGQTDDKEWKGN